MFDMLRPAEKVKIDCGKVHFKALGDDVDFTVADNFDTFMDKVTSLIQIAHYRIHKVTFIAKMALAVKLPVDYSQ